MAGDVEVSSIYFDNRKIVSGSIFVAIRGVQTDGHKFLLKAIQAGAISIVIEAEDAEKAASFLQRENLPTEHIIVAFAKSTRLALAELAAANKNFPSRELFTVAVTGTNGKTTSTYMIEHVLNSGGLPTGVIGTIDHHLENRVWPTSMTTPDSVEFQSRLSDFLEHGARAVALEASSHALDQRRLDCVDFDLAIFTNLSRDHLDYHHAMEEYFLAKHRLFSELLIGSSKSKRVALFNAGDIWSSRSRDLLEKSFFGSPSPLTLWSFGEALQSPNAEFRYRVKSQGFDGVGFELLSAFGNFEIHLTMPGLHNIENAIGAFAAGVLAGMEPAAIVKALTKLKGVPGRLERVPNARDLRVFVDYAHTDDALKAILAMLDAIRRQAQSDGVLSSAAHLHRDSGAKLITVFGCGGDRDRGKRPLMMRAALDGSDAVVLTSDNPRSEDPEQILDDAMAAVQTFEHVKVRRYVDRRVAIAKALEIAQSGDVVLIAGKGHETTQQIGDTKHPFSDVQVAHEILEGKPNV